MASWPYSLLRNIAAAAAAATSCPTLWDPIEGSPPGSAVPGILQARTLEWVAISFSNAWKWKVKVKSLSRVRPSVTPWTTAYQAPPSIGFSRQEYWSGVPLPSLQKHSKHLVFLLPVVFFLPVVHSMCRIQGYFWTQISNLSFVLCLFAPMPHILNLILAMFRLSGTAGEKFPSIWNLFLTFFIHLWIFSTFNKTFIIFFIWTITVEV